MEQTLKERQKVLNDLMDKLNHKTREHKRQTRLTREQIKKNGENYEASTRNVA